MSEKRIEKAVELIDDCPVHDRVKDHAIETTKAAYGHSSFRNILPREFAAAALYHSSYSIALLDIDSDDSFSRKAASRSDYYLTQNDIRLMLSVGKHRYAEYLTDALGEWLDPYDISKVRDTPNNHSDGTPYLDKFIEEGRGLKPIGGKSTPADRVKDNRTGP